MMSSIGPLFGRDAERDVLRQVLDAGSGAIVRGPLGIGKTYLVRSVVEHTSMNDQKVAWVVALRANPTPLAPFGAVVDGLADSAPAGQVARVASALAAYDLIVVDDIQWLDNESVAAVSLAAQQGRRLVATVRTGEQAPDIVRRLVREHAHERIDLDRLNNESIAALVRHLLGDTDTHTVQRIVAKAHGNPLFAREIVRDLTESGVLEREHGVWFWSGSNRRSTATGLRDVVADRLTNLPDAEADALRLIAFAEPVMVARSHALASDDTLRSLERRALVEEINGQLRVAHPVFSDVLRSASGPIETRATLARLTELLPLDELDADDVLRWSYWALAGGIELAPTTWMQLVRAAFTVSDRGHALDLAERAVDAGAGVRGQVAIGRAHALLGNVSDAEEALRPIVLDTGLDPSIRTEAARYLLYAQEFRPQQWDEFDEFARWLIDSLTDDEDRAEISVQWAASLALGGRFEAAGELALPLLDHRTPRIALRALTPASSALLAGGQCRRATEVAVEHFPLALQHVADVPEGIGWVFTVMCTGQVFDGQVQALADGTAAAMASLTDRNDGEGASQARAVVSLAAGRAALLAGRLRTARADFLAALAVYRRQDPQRWRGLAAAHLAEAAALMGDRRTSAEAANESLTRVVHVPARVTEIERSLAWRHVATGDLAAARTALHAVAERARAESFLPAEMFAGFDLIRLGDRPGAAFMLERLGDFDSGWADPFRHAANGSVDGDDDAWRRAADGFEVLGAWMYAAEAWCAGSLILREQGRRQSAEAFVQRAHGALAHCEGVHSATIAGLADTVALTPRERQVATNAALGSTTKQIAVELELSPRTVDNLLSRTYQKLGISRRADLAAALGLDDSTLVGR